MLVLGFIASASVLAESYTFYRPSNTSAQVLANEHFETPFTACAGVVGLFYDQTTPTLIEASSFNPGDGSCVARLDTPALAGVNIASVSGSCPDEIEFDFALQDCQDRADLEELYNLVGALFGFTVLSLGMIVGLKLGA